MTNAQLRAIRERQRRAGAYPGARARQVAVLQAPKKDPVKKPETVEPTQEQKKGTDALLLGLMAFFLFS